MACHRISFIYERTVTCYVEAETQEDVEGFLDSHPDWQPADVPGLIDVVGDELETGYAVAPEETITANFRITENLDLVEVDS